MESPRKRGRPPLEDHELLHPRKVWVRPTVLRGEILDVPQPSEAALKRWSHIVEACVAAILTQPSRAYNIAPKNKVAIKFESSWKKPTDFLKGVLKYTCAEYKVREFNAEQLLLWLYVRKLAPYCASDIYKERQGIMNSFGRMERELEIMLDEVVEVDHNESPSEQED
jgi:hypothetical protein